MKMTPQELIETAQYLNPEKLASNPAEALQDAYTYSEALRVLNMASPKAAAAVKRAPAPSNSDSPKSLVAALAQHYQHRSHSMSEIGNAIGVSTSTIGLWLRGKTKPTRDKLGKIRTFLDAQTEKAGE